MSAVVADTHALVWHLFEPERISFAAMSALTAVVKPCLYASFRYALTLYRPPGHVVTMRFPHVLKR